MRGIALSGLNLTACVQGRTPLIKGAFDVTQIIAPQRLHAQNISAVASRFAAVAPGVARPERGVG